MKTQEGFTELLKIVIFKEETYFAVIFMIKYNIGGSKSIYKGEFADESFSVEHDSAGIIGMAKKGGRKHSNECQFYITLGEMKYFDKKYVAFGRIIKGYATIKEIEKVECYLQRPLQRVTIKKSGDYSANY